MRAAAPPLGGPRQRVRRLAVPGTGAGTRARLRWARGGGAARKCMGGRGLRAASPATCTWGRSHAPTLSEASALWAPARGASRRARACGGPGRQVRAGASPEGAREARAQPPAGVVSGPPHARTRQSSIPRLQAPGRCSPSAARSSSPPGAARGPSPAGGRRAEPALFTWRCRPRWQFHGTPQHLPPEAYSQGAFLGGSAKNR
ncbi:basic salivary proline-rich protein 2-like [Mustela erminea]|uniref:basic salivary proline-rich protein 2-like n=1 Tax=Mustela erminea TaxID=36723 RepID=UPI00138751CF|nr:basic salivary proline-rich protein 2-like [Mustela erminea]